MKSLYINREVSWLEFNQRVLEEAKRKDLPLMERIKFLAITASNLDEFMQVRVGGLTSMIKKGIRKKDLTGLTPSAQLRLIRERSEIMMNDQNTLWLDELIPLLSQEKIHFLDPQKLTPLEKEKALQFFNLHTLPLLTPIGVDSLTPDKTLNSLALYLSIELKATSGKKASRFVFLELPRSLPRFINISDTGNHEYLLLEELVSLGLTALFPEEEILSSIPFRVTRNTDLILEDEESDDLAEDMENILTARRFSFCVRLEVPAGSPKSHLQMIQEITKTPPSSLFRSKGPLDLSALMSLMSLNERDDLFAEAWPIQPSASIQPNQSMFKNIAQQDHLLIHPYESFEPVIRLLEEAAVDPDVLSIKQVLYRTASQSRVVEALIKAAENGKQVTVLVELKARFDEARNLTRADELQEAGAQVIYGVRGFKTHAKITLIIRKEDMQLKRYLHLGTGNYNESTAKLYGDLSYLTCREEYGSDATAFFNAVTGWSKMSRFQKLSPAPHQMKPRLLELIQGETRRAKAGEEAHLMGKFNSLQDREIIDALYQAAEAGVRIQLNIRGICCLKTDQKKHKGRIEVTSIIDRYLEHARVFYFRQGGNPTVLISSADWMTRNLEKRLELLIPIDDKKIQRRLIAYLQAAFKDNQQAYRILADGTSEKISPPKSAKAYRFQKNLQTLAEQSAKSQRQKRSSTFEPHEPAS